MTLDIAEGRSYDVINTNTWETARLDVHEINRYQGQLMVYATKPLHEVHYNGVHRVPERAVSFVILPNELPDVTFALRDRLLGMPLALATLGSGYAAARLGAKLQVLPIVTANNRSGIWTGSLHTRDEHLAKCQRVIDMFVHWKRHGSWPALRAPITNGALS